jgi:hypothetical protein
MDDKRRGEIAYLYMKYSMRYQTPLGINVPITSFTSTRWSGYPIEPWQMQHVIDDIVVDLKDDNFTVLCDDNQKMSAEKRGEIALAFVIDLFEDTDIKLDEHFRSGLQRFCHLCKVCAEEGRAFFREILDKVIKKKMEFVFDPVDWKETKAFL